MIEEDFNENEEEEEEDHDVEARRRMQVKKHRSIERLKSTDERAGDGSFANKPNQLVKDPKMSGSAKMSTLQVGL